MSTPATWFGTALAASPVMGVFRGASPREAVALAGLAWDAGAELVEVPIETPAAVPSLRAVVDAARDRGKVVGAGTILDVTQLGEAIAAGAGFLVSPLYDPAIASEARATRLPLIPGVATATELHLARAAGHEHVKAFPASVLGTAWFAAMRGPFPGVRLVATGGMTAANAAEFLAAGADVVGVGGAFGDPAGRERLAEIISTARGAVSS